MRFLVGERKWDWEFTEPDFLEWFHREVEAGNLHAVTDAMNTLEKRHEPLVTQAFLELERKQPFRRDQTREEQERLPLSQLVARLADRCLPVLAEILIGAGVSFGDQDWPHRGLDYFETLGRSFAARGDVYLLGQCWLWRGRMYSRLRDFASDLPCFWQALRLFQDLYAHKDISETARTMAALGLSDVQQQMVTRCLFLEDYDDAILYNFRALSIRQRFEDHLRLGATLMNIGLCHRMKNHLDRGLLYYLRTVLSDLEVGRAIARGITCENLSSLALMLHEPQLARGFSEKALTFDSHRAGLLENHARVLIEQEEYENAKRFLQRIVDQRGHSAPQSHARAYEMLIRLCEKFGPAEQALHWRELFIDWLVRDAFLVAVEDEATCVMIRSRLEQVSPLDYRAHAILQFSLGDAQRSAAELDLALSSLSENADEQRQILLALRQRIQERDKLNRVAPKAPDTGLEQAAGKNALICRACESRFQPGERVDGKPSDSLCPECCKARQLEQLVHIPAGVATLHDGKSKSLPAFFMDKSPVTNRLFKIYHGVMRLNWEPSHWRQALFQHPDQPMTCVNLNDCEKFCSWRSRLTGRSYRLPTMADWYRAALGDDGRTYPWGNEPPDYTRAAYSLLIDTDAVPAPVGLFPDGASPFGVLDMAGNVAEWTSSLDEQSRPIYLGGSCGTDARSLNPKNLLVLSLYPADPECREYRQIGFRCVAEESNDELLR